MNQEKKATNQGEKTTRQPKYDRNTGFPKRLYDLLGGDRGEYAKLARAIGVSTAAISNYTSGFTGVSADNLIAIAKYFNVSTDYLLGLDEIPNRAIESEENMVRYMAQYLALNVKTIKLLHEGSNSSTRLLFEHILDSTVSKMAQEFLDLSKNGATIEIGRPENSLDDPIEDFIENGNIQFGDDTPLDMSLSLLHEENKMLKEKGE